MDITVGLFLTLFALAFIAEFIDSAMGMGYGTLLTPILIIMGFDPLVVVPAILLSQAFGGMAASVFHHQFHNVRFDRSSPDFKAFLVIGGLGVVATIFAALLSLKLPPLVLKTYIGALVLVMGAVILRNRTYTFTWKKLIGLGILSAFNKGLSGGGFGPVVTGGQVMSGMNPRNAVGVTTLAEAPICLAGFMTFIVGRTVLEHRGGIMQMPFAEFAGELFSSRMFQWELLLALLLGSLFVSPFGALTTRLVRTSVMRPALGVLITVMGGWMLFQTWR
ncbi:MAG: sulfite exporter TauE/SafE family protein [Candidatus Krumholzibacteriia bacterium]